MPSFAVRIRCTYKEVYTILDGVQGQGHYVGVYMAWGVNNNLWWGEGEIKFYIDGDADFPTICGTGTEDYFGGAWGFEQPPGRYSDFSSPFSGMPQVIRSDGLNKANTRIWLISMACDGPDSFQAGPARHHSSARAGAWDWRESLATSPCRMISRPQHSGIR